MSASPQDAVVAHESLVVLTRDEILLGALQAIAPTHEVFTVGTEDELAAHLLASPQSAVAMLDTGAVASPIEHLTEKLRAQFPDLVLIVAGEGPDQSALTAQITQGTVYRFLHKPVSEQRVRLFVEAAWRWRGQGHSRFESTTPAGAAPPQPPALGRKLLMVGAIAGAVALAGGAWFALREPDLQGGRPAAASGKLEAPMAAVDDVLESLLARAHAAFDKGVLVGPAAHAPNAADLYRQALQRNPNDPRARNGLEQVIDKLLSAAEAELSGRHFEQAQRLAEQARSIEPDHAKAAFLLAQIGKERERALLAQARAAASSGNVQQALSVLDGATPVPSGGAPSSKEAHQLEQQKLEQRVQDFLRRAQDRMGHGLLVEPAEDNARFYIESARALSPEEPDVSKAERRLLVRLFSEAHQALAAGNLEAGEHWIQAAAESGMERNEISSLEREARGLRAAAQAAGRSAGQASEAGADDSSINTAANEATARQNLPHQPATVSAPAPTPKASGGMAATTPEASGGVAATAPEASGGMAAPTPKASGGMAAPTPEASGVMPVLTHYAAPVFPEPARQRNVSGWVDLQFVIGTDGAVREVSIAEAEPAGFFEQAAMDAVRKWRYRPALRDGKPVSQRTRLRVRFALQQ